MANGIVVSVATQKQIIAEKIHVWKQAQYDVMLDLRIARKIKDEGMEANVMARMKRCEAAIMELETVMAELSDVKLELTMSENSK